MNAVKSIAFSCVLLPLAVPAATTFTGDWNVTTAIPDNDDVGFADSHLVTAPDITEIQSVTVALDFSGGWNGDLYAYLVHDTGFTVLLNRPGRDTASPDGSAAGGMTVVLDDLAASDIHTAIPMSGGPVAGAYQPDGRITDPLAVLAGDPRSATFASFTGLDANGTWSLFVADQSAGNVSTLQSWTLTITGVPEPSAAFLAPTAALLWLRRRRDPGRAS